MHVAPQRVVHGVYDASLGVLPAAGAAGVQGVERGVGGALLAERPHVIHVAPLAGAGVRKARHALAPAVDVELVDGVGGLGGQLCPPYAAGALLPPQLQALSAADDGPSRVAGAVAYGSGIGFAVGRRERKGGGQVVGAVSQPYGYAYRVSRQAGQLAGPLQRGHGFFDRAGPTVAAVWRYENVNGLGRRSLPYGAPGHEQAEKNVFHGVRKKENGKNR